MKQIVLIICAVLIANLSIAQFETSFSRTGDFSPKAKFMPEARTVKAFDRNEILTDSYNRSRVEIPVIYTENFDEEEGTNPWSITMSKDPSLGDLDWMIGDQVVDMNPEYKMDNYFGGSNVASISQSGKKFAYYNAISFAYTPGLASLRSKGSMTIGPFDFSNIANPVVRWTQYYRKFNHDETYVEYSTDNINFNRIRVNDIISGNAQRHNNLAFVSETANKATVYIRFTWEELSSLDVNSGGGYGWQIDDVEILDNIDYEIKLGSICTSFFYAVRNPSNATAYHASSTYMRIPKEELEKGYGLSFAAPFENNGNLAVKPKLTVLITDPNGKEVFNKSHVYEKEAIKSGKTDTLEFPTEDAYAFSFVKDPNLTPEIVAGEYKVKFTISVPGHENEESNLLDNVDSTVFIVTDNKVYSRDLDKTNVPIGPDIWYGQALSNNEVGTTFDLFGQRTVNSVEVFIHEDSQPDNSFRIVVYRAVGDGKTETLQEGPEIEISDENRGKWVKVEFEDAEPVPTDDKGAALIIVMAKMQYNNPDQSKKVVRIGADPTTKASAWGTYWRFPSASDSPDLRVISNTHKVGLCMRVNFDDETSILEHDALAEVKLYPNPANDYVNIQASEEITSIEVLSIMGTVVSSHNVNDNTYTYATNGLSNGNYILRVHTKNNVIVKQFSVVK